MADEKEGADKKRVSQFPPRGSRIGRAVADVIGKKTPAIGGSQGDFRREPCGTCLSWRRDPRAGQGPIPLTAGQCLFGPPTPHPITDEAGQMRATVVIRPPMASDSEGCDQHDDGIDDDGGGETKSVLAVAG